VNGNLDMFVRRFHADGFVVIPGAIPPEEMEHLRSMLHRYIDNVAPHLPAGDIYYEDTNQKSLKALHNLDRHSVEFRDLRNAPRLTRIVEAVFGTDAISGGCSLFAKGARVGSVTPPHQDQAFQFWEPAEALTLTIAIDESTAENGPLICLNGSHRLGLLPHLQSGVLGFSQRLETYPPETPCKEVGLFMKPGDISLHHVLTVHRSDENHSARSRWQFGISYHSVRAVRDDRAFEKYWRALKNLHESAANSSSDSGR
jgi:phytanoyl-CoA hydroxylase